MWVVVVVRRGVRLAGVEVGGRMDDVVYSSVHLSI